MNNDAERLHLIANVVGACDTLEEKWSEATVDFDGRDYALPHERALEATKTARFYAGMAAQLLFAPTDESIKRGTVSTRKVTF